MLLIDHTHYHKCSTLPRGHLVLHLGMANLLFLVILNACVPSIQNLNVSNFDIIMKNTCYCAYLRQN